VSLPDSGMYLQVHSALHPKGPTQKTAPPWEPQMSQNKSVNCAMFIYNLLLISNEIRHADIWSYFYVCISDDDLISFPINFQIVNNPKKSCKAQDTQ
jgi:hypothetical protein